VFIFYHKSGSVCFLTFMLMEKTCNGHQLRYLLPTARHGHIHHLSSYLCKIKRKENSSCSACGHSLQDLTYLLLDCPASEPVCAPSLALLLPLLFSGPGYWVSVDFIHAPIPRKGSGSTTTAMCNDPFLRTIFYHFQL